MQQGVSDHSLQRKIKSLRRDTGKIVTTLLIATVAAIALFGCGSGGSGSTSKGGSGGTGGTSTGPSGSGGNSGVLSAQTISAFLNGVNTKYQSIQSTTTDPDARNQAMVAYLKTQPEVASAGISQAPSVWAVLRNGHHLIVDDNTRHETVVDPNAPVLAGPITRAVSAHRAAPAAKRSVGSSAPTRQTASRDASSDPVLPAAQTGRVLHALGDLFTPTASFVEKYLTLYGYNVINQDATVEALRAVHGDGVFYIDTHGDLSYDPATQTNFWSVWTATPVTESNVALYKSDLDDGSMVYWVANNTVQNGKAVPENHFAITAKFPVKYQWDFAENSIVFFNCCYGINPSTFMTTLAKPAASAFGWSISVSDNWSAGVAEYICDRLTGLNVCTPVEAVGQRPFDTTEILNDLQNKHIAFGDSKGKCKLQLAGSRSVGLLPSIKQMTVTERIGESPIHGSTKLTLTGWFGKDQGTVSINGTEVPVISWAADTIVCQPADVPGAGFSGNVVVKLDERESNSVALTQWHGTVTYSTLLLPTIVTPAISRVTVDAYIRADVQVYREHAGQAPIKPQGITFRASQGSKCNWVVDGPPPIDCAWTGPLAADMPFGLNGSVQAPYGTGYLLQGVLDVKAGTAGFGMTFLNCVTAYQPVGGSLAQALATIRDNLLIGTVSGINTSDGSQILSTPTSTIMDSDFVIAGKTFQGSSTILNPKLEISDFIPSEAPDPTKGENQGR